VLPVGASGLGKVPDIAIIGRDAGSAEQQAAHHDVGVHDVVAAGHPEQVPHQLRRLTIESGHPAPFEESGEAATAGLLRTWASTVAGTIGSAPRSIARSRISQNRDRSRSAAIRAPASYTRSVTCGRA
jgi:hypothetical protein